MFAVVNSEGRMYRPRLNRRAGLASLRSLGNSGSSPPIAALHSDDILLILLSAIHAHRVEEFPSLVNNFPNDALHWGAVHVYIDHAQEDADPSPAAPVPGGRDIGDLTVRWRHYSARGIRDDAIRVTKEPKEKSRQNQRRQCPNWTRQPGKH